MEEDDQFSQGPKTPVSLFLYLPCTVWKFRNFSVSQILREINFGKVHC